MKWELAIVALAVLVVAGASRRLVGTPVTPAMVFTALGLLVGPLVAGEVNAAPTSESVRLLAESTLAVVLFSDAARIRLRALRREYSVPVRLLAVGLPLTIVCGALAAAMLLQRLSLAEALVLGVVLAPTDAALGQAVVTEPRLPSRIRQGLNVESGLNDGICVPLLLIALVAADIEAQTMSSGHALRIVAEEIGYGAVGGLGAGLLVSALVVVCRRQRLIAGSWLQVIPVAAAALAYGTASALGGSGFIAAFLAGALFGALVPGEAEEAARLPEEIGDLLGGVTLFMFGAVLLGPALEHLSWPLAAYAVLSLTAVRMVPVALGMLGSRARPATVAFLGWFGPRGLASIVFAVITVESAHLPQADTILTAAYCTVGLSVMAHGISAAPLAGLYARWYAGHPRHGRPEMESLPVPGHRTRGPLSAGGTAGGISSDLGDEH